MPAEVSREKVEKFIYLVACKREPKLRNHFTVSFEPSIRGFDAARNGKGTLLKFSILPTDPRFPQTLENAVSALVQIVEERPTFPPAEEMTPRERLGWDRLLSLGANLTSYGTRPALDLRMIKILRPDQASLFTWAIQAVCSPLGTNHFIEIDSKPSMVVTTEKDRLTSP